MSDASIKYTVPGEGTIQLNGDSSFVLAAHAMLIDWTFRRIVDREVAKGRNRDDVLTEINEQVKSELARLEREGPNDHATATITGYSHESPERWNPTSSGHDAD